MADDPDDQWLYGESDPDKLPVENGGNDSTDQHLYPDKSNGVPNTEEVLEPPVIQPLSKDEAASEKESQNLIPELPVISEPSNETLTEQPSKETNVESGTVNESNENEQKEKDSDEEDEEDDNINVVIGDLRTTPGYGSGLHLKRGNLLTLTKQPGKFNVEDFDSPGLINGGQVHEFNLDTLEDKPWRQPGADITDYFNYGFNEDTWRAYCERQKRMRVHESGSGLIPMNLNHTNINMAPPNMQQHIAQVKPIPPAEATLQPPPGMINQSAMIQMRRPSDNAQKENIIQVMTADRREYSRKNFTQDMSIPPPMIPPPFQSMPPGPLQPPFIGNPYGHGEYFPPEMDPYYQPPQYEPMHDSWMGQEWNTPSSMDVKNVISLTNTGTSSEMNGSNEEKGDMIPNIKIKTEPDDREYTGRSKEYERENRDRHKERSHRHRSRSRSHDRRSSRKHKSRSRSPSHRSHKKKKSKKSERKDDSSD